MSDEINKTKYELEIKSSVATKVSSTLAKFILLRNLKVSDQFNLYIKSQDILLFTN